MTIIVLCDGPTLPAATRSTVYLPFVATAPANTDPDQPPEPVATFYDRLLHDGRQQRARLTRCLPLEAGAMQRAWGLAHGQPWAHKDSSGLWANGIARAAGCPLPAEYDNDHNYIESLTAGMPDPNLAFDSLARSDHHKIHLFGENDFYRQQYHVGIGYAQNPDAPYQYYWCIWICRCQH